MPATTLSVRLAAPADAAAISSLLAELGHPTDAAAVPARIAAVRAEGGMAIVATDGAGRVIGLLSASRHAVVHRAGPVALITALVVTAPARGRGAGRALVAAARTWAEAAGCARLVVTSAERRADAHAFYAASGLPYTGRRFSAELPAGGATGGAR